MITDKYFTEKQYSIPINIPDKHTYKYMEIIDKGYIKYLDIIYNCDKFIMFQQLYSISYMLDGYNRTYESNLIMCNGMIKRLEELGFISTDYLNQNKYVHLKKSGIAAAVGDYNHDYRVTLSKLKNESFMISLLKAEYFIARKEIISNTTMFEQLMDITKKISNAIRKQNNKFGYDTIIIDEIIASKSYSEVLSILNNQSEYTNKLGVIRHLWNGLGNVFKNFILARHTITSIPQYFKLYVSYHSGEILIHYVPNIIMFDVNHELKFYKDKSIKLFHSFFTIESNELKGIQSSFISSGYKTMGYEGANHIGYSVTLIGSNPDVLDGKKMILDYNMENTEHSPHMCPTTTVCFDISRYIGHSSRKGNKHSTAHNDRIDKMIINRMAEISNKANSNTPLLNKSTNGAAPETELTPGKNIVGILDIN